MSQIMPTLLQLQVERFEKLVKESSDKSKKKSEAKNIYDNLLALVKVIPKNATGELASMV